MTDSEWNYDLIMMAQAQIADAQNDMARCLHKGEVVDIVRDRMVDRLRSAADDLEKMKPARHCTARQCRLGIPSGEV